MPKTMLAMPIRINAGRQPGAGDELTIDWPFGVEGRVVTDFIQLSNGCRVLATIEKGDNAEGTACAARLLSVRQTRSLQRVESQYCFRQPIPLTIDGPSRVATASGNRFQTAINIPSFGFRGFKSGIGVPGDKRNW
jgi:hypothetical protein